MDRREHSRCGVLMFAYVVQQSAVNALRITQFEDVSYEMQAVHLNFHSKKRFGVKWCAHYAAVKFRMRVRLEMKGCCLTRLLLGQCCWPKARKENRGLLHLCHMQSRLKLVRNSNFHILKILSSGLYRNGEE